ncbi:MAG: tetratricopeptide repeat protein [bacterium]|nr:tetratricopeptide repeat protein [bacterium]
MINKLLIILFLIFKFNISAWASNSDSSKVNALNDACFDNLYSNISLAKKQAFGAVQLATAINFQKGLAGAYNRVGVVYDVSGNFDSALYFYQKALTLNKALKNLKGQGSALSNIGLTYWNKGDYSNALNSFYAAIKPLEAIKHYHYLGNCFNNIGLVYTDLRNTPKSKLYFDLALKNYDLAGREYEKASVLCNIAMIYARENRPDSSIAINQQAIKIYEKGRDNYNLGKCYHNIADEYRTIKNNDLAIASYLKAIEYHKLSDNKTGLGESLMYLSELYMNFGNDALAQKYVNEAFLICSEIESPKVLSNIYFHYAIVKQRLGEYKIAAQYFVKVKYMRDSLFRTETSQLIANTEAQYGVEKKESENKQLQQQNKIQELQIANAQNEIKSRKQMTYGIIGFGLLLTLSGYLYYRRRQIMQNLIARNLVHEAEQHQRISISHDLHDNVGAQLSYIVTNLEVIQNIVPENKRLQSVADMSKQAILTLRETVWALNHETITTEAFADKFKQYGLKMLDFNSSVQCNFYENLKSSEVLKPLQALNLFRICQEAFSNAVRHSKASKIEVFFYNSEFSVFDFKIEDNGIGFNENEGLAKGHFGLQNMQARAREVGAEYYMNSESGFGTTIIINLLK